MEPKETNSVKIVILGAGVTGLCAALRLTEAQSEPATEILILEEKPYPGGLLHTTRREDFWWDDGVFNFQGNNYLYKVLPELFQPIEGGVLQKVWIQGGIHDFPLAKRLVLRQPKLALLAIAFDYLYSYLRCSLGCDGTNLQDWLRYRLTSRLLRLSHLDYYVSKMQGLPLTELSPSLGWQRLAALSELTRPVRLFYGIFASQRKIQEIVRQREPDVYPFKGGVGAVAGKLAELIQRKGVGIAYGARVTGVRLDQTGVEIEYETAQGPQAYRADYAISTIPLEVLAETIKPAISAAAREAAQGLSYLDLRLLFLVVKRPMIFDKYFILYSFEPHHLWKRLLSLALPNGLCAVTVETGFRPRAEALPPDLASIIIRQLTQELHLFAPEELVAQYEATVHRAYPIYQLRFEEKVARIISEVESDRLRLAGRQGRFLYVTTPGAIQSGIDAAERIIQASKEGGLYT